MTQIDPNYNCNEHLWPFDAHGNTLHEGSRVFTYNYGFTLNTGSWIREYGTLYRDMTNPELWEWYIQYDAGERTQVSDFCQVYKV